MDARVTTLSVSDPDVVFRLMREADSEVRALPGFESGLGLVDRERGQVMIVTLWQSAQARDESAASASHILSRAATALQGAPERHGYRVLLNRPGSPRKFARVSRFTADSKERLAQLSDSSGEPSIVTDASRQPGYAGFLILADEATLDVMGMTFWDSREHLEQSERAYYDRDMKDARTGIAGGTWQRSVYEVALDSLEA